MKILVTGAAGFIGFHVAQGLLARGDEVVGLDNLNDYYDPRLKAARLEILRRHEKFHFVKLDLVDRGGIEALFAAGKFERVIHLAAQAGVRYSIENPHIYVESNLTGFLHIIEGCRHHGVGHLVYASTSSVYGANTHLPFDVDQNVDHPLTLYAATKKANELMAHSYSSLYGLPTTGIRFFSVYGPWGRPDMALFKFTVNILAGKPIDVFNYGKHRRDFTYVGDIAAGVIAAIDHVARPDPGWNSQLPNPATSRAPYRLYNIGNQRSVELMHYIELLEKCLGRKAQINLLPLQPGDVPDTLANVDALAHDVGYRAGTPVEEGVKRFVEWYFSYYHSQDEQQLSAHAIVAADAAAASPHGLRANRGSFE
jgi:UDP-glucuronate 4-epimerase